MPDSIPLVIIGAGPFGLALAAYVSARSQPYLLLGRPMEFWKSNMPEGLYLRSDLDWHLDPDNLATLDQFIAEHCLSPQEMSPLPLQRYLEYVEWFMRRKRIEPRPDYVTRTEYLPGRAYPYRLTLANGDLLDAARVVAAPGFKSFRNIPPELARLLPAGRYHHTCDATDLGDYAGRRVLIIGGRQSAFEWAALLCENGAREVHVSFRHDTPLFADSDWSWLATLLELTETDPGWYRRLPPAEQEAVARRCLAEARMKLSPWLVPRINQPNVYLHPHTNLRYCGVAPSGAMLVEFDSGAWLEVDDAILATGYRADITRLPYLADGNVFQFLDVRNGYPVLDGHFQTNLDGLYITSLPAVQDFGMFFAFTIAVRAAARLIGASILKTHVPPALPSTGGLGKAKFSDSRPPGAARPDGAGR